MRMEIIHLSCVSSIEFFKYAFKEKKTKLDVWLHYYPPAIVNGFHEKCLNNT